MWEWIGVHEKKNSTKHPKQGLQHKTKQSNQNRYSVLEEDNQSEGKSTKQVNKELKRVNGKKPRSEEKSYNIEKMALEEITRTINVKTSNIA